MSRPPVDLPERLLTRDATEFERRMLAAALEKKPSPAASARMAKALGVTVTTVTATATAGTALAAGAAAAKAPVAAGAAVWPWISAGLVGLVVAGAVVARRTSRMAPVETAPVSAPATAPAPSVETAGEPSQPAKDVTQRSPAPVAASRRITTTATGAVTEQTAFIDAARAAVADRSGRRALEILRRYQERYPAGLFRPEATALKVEALIHLGRDGEARALAERFVAEHRGTLLAARVAEIAGLMKP
jgi:hypothetical protein